MSNLIAIKSAIRNKYYDLYVRREDMRSICLDGLYSDAFYELSDDLQLIYQDRDRKFTYLRDLYFAYLEGISDVLGPRLYHEVRIAGEQAARDHFERHDKMAQGSLWESESALFDREYAACN